MELVIWTRGAARHPGLGDGCLGTAERGRWKLRRVGGVLEACWRHGSVLPDSFSPFFKPFTTSSLRQAFGSVFSPFVPPVRSPHGAW